MNHIRSLREERKWSRRELARKVKISEQNLYLLESGRVKLMAKHVPGFCAAFNVKPDRLMSLGRGRQARPVPACYIDFVSEALIESAVKQAEASGAAAQALRQKLRYAVARAKQGIGVI
jgi:transcriptional regulator with XRE-family HTH domain